MAIEVFALPGIGSSDALLDWLEYQELPVRVRDCRHDEDALAEATALGGGTLPVARRGRKVVVGFDPEAIGRLLRAGAEVGAGLEVETDPDGRPVVVSVEPGSKADLAGLRPGDVIAELGGYRNFGLPDLERVLGGARRSVKLTVRRDEGLVETRLPA